MTERPRRPTDEGTGIYTPRRPRAADGAPPVVAAAAPPVESALGPTGSSDESFENDVTDETPRPGMPVVEHETPTRIDPPPAIEQGAPTELTAALERSEPIRVISMKDHSGPQMRRTDERRAMHVQLRSMAEVSGHHDSQVDLGHLAPPRDPKQARNRRLIDNVIWGCVAIMLACAIMLTIWLVAGR